MYPPSDTVATERRHGSGAYRLRPIAIARGEGAWLYDESGERYLDLTSGYGVANLGHAHPAIQAAIAEQGATLVTCPGTLPTPTRAALIPRLRERLPAGIERFFFCNSGAEAIEGAIKIARLATGRRGIVATMRGFHGRTLGALSATWNPAYRRPFEPLLPDVHHVPFGDLDAASAVIGDDCAAVLVEVVQGEGGVRPAPRGYLPALQALCAERGALLIVDEVQTGFGRTGRWFACEHYGITPDLICLGKAIAGGVPMGAIGIAERVGAIPPGSHGSTFGGNPLACAAALATLETIEREGLVERSEQVGARLIARLRDLDSPSVREVRGLGMMIGIELRHRVTPVLAALLERRVLALPAGSTVLRLLPPLVINEEALDSAVEAIAAALTPVGEEAPA